MHRRLRGQRHDRAIRRLPGSGCATYGYSEIRGRVHGPPLDQHPEIQMWPIGQPRSANRRNLLASGDCPPAIQDHRRDQPKVTVDPDKSGMLDHHLQPTHAVFLNPNDRSRRNRAHRRAQRRWQVDAGVKAAGKRPAWKQAGSKRRRDAGRHNRWQHAGTVVRQRRRGWQRRQRRGNEKRSAPSPTRHQQPPEWHQTCDHRQRHGIDRINRRRLASAWLIQHKPRVLDRRNGRCLRRLGTAWA